MNRGGEATVNGWLQAAVLGLPLVDLPCNGRAHPTGVMGSMNLHKITDYKTVQACVGGNPETGSHVECFFEEVSNIPQSWCAWLPLRQAVWLQ